MAKRARRGKRLSVYANLVASRRSKADARSRRRAEYLATLPKNPIKRLLYRLNPKRVVKFWFSRDGGKLFLKLAVVGVVIIAIFIAALFAFYRRELDAIRPGELAKKVQTTVTTYTDRNGELLWEDKGDGEYKQVIDAKDIPKIMKDATVALEDRDFYKHGGISISGIMRATINNVFGGGDTQGASTLTQQLIKNVFFSEDAEANRLNISRKIKEAILSIEVERMYNKDQILTLYLNEVPYGGRRNGVESAALTYFGKHAKDLNIAEAALLASIPQNPSYYDPYQLHVAPERSKDLLDRQHFVISQMQEQGYITKEQADEAKTYAILDNIKPELSATEGIKAPHFVLEVRAKLEAELTKKVVREGGLVVKTTLDYRIQQFAEDVVNNQTTRKAIAASGADTIAMTSVDVPTGQVLAQIGSLDYRDTSIDGQVNGATANQPPGSSIKPLIYANLFKQRQGTNYGAGTMLTDTNIDSIYCKGNTSGKCHLANFDGKYFGPIAIRDALGNSRNPPAIEAAYLGGADAAFETTRDAGNIDYCKDTNFLSGAIGSGCEVHVDQHTNAYATLARQGVYKPVAYVLEVKNAQGQVIKEWKDESKRVLDSQITYILSDILTDQQARSRVFGPTVPGFNIAGVKTATKTGTTDDGQGHVKDGWMMSYTPRMATGVWAGKHDGKGIKSATSQGTGAIVREVMGKAHKEVFAKDGSWKEGDWFTKPNGVQSVSVNGKTDLYPSWYQKPANAEGQKVMFDSVSKKKATSCTPERAKTEQTVQTLEDPVTKEKTVISPAGFDANADDDIHKCDDVKPFVTVSKQLLSAKTYRIKASVAQGTHSLSSVDITVDGQVISSQPAGSAGDYTIDHTFTSGNHTIGATVVDQALYDSADTDDVTVAGKKNDEPLILGRRGRWGN